MTNIILCGGNGTRLWPISRTLMPKQFVKMFDNQSLFQSTVKRNKSLCSQTFIVSNSEQYFLALDQLEELDLSKNSKYLLEPLARNTAPAIALACFALAYDEILLVTPSDHLIKNQKEYEKVLQSGKELALQNNLVTFGITPTYPETGFGYIEANDFDVKAFHEKPDEKTANLYFEHGNYFWNSGMFCFKAGVFLDELKKYSPKVYEASLKAYENAKNDEMIRIKFEDMEKIPEDSIDYAVMEKSSIVKVIPSDIQWTDLGSFDSLYDELPKDESGNTQNPNHISCDSKNNLIYGVERKIATIDVDDLIIVDTADALLVSKRGSSQKVKTIVKKLKDLDHTLQNIHLKVHRPWGTYTVLEDTKGYKIKKIEVKPGKRLSLQKHYHRNEHWIVVSGIATVTIGDKTSYLKPNESTYIKMGEVHRLANDGKIPIILIEAQVGEYTGEDDIVRLDDDFKR
ncbi:mannose-1-phosphate guanylyltransferase/mannose-6-phosphate isomerase [Halarcobacter sp.]|uniref:mannose-1-phosphate guanylyltransferase/mannose-6-phosphate isomerase n=1 Tax=Halarcobacter sp. TaxID=2321133 RepID=UPI0029F49082|nr:mannose-1-phosphate guanylyltransferase/mannose-6-phosphate isomerase [Halarcobacter sp.]